MNKIKASSEKSLNLDITLANPPYSLPMLSFIDYRVGNKALDKFNQLLNDNDETRPECCLFVSETNDGKTALARRFTKHKNSKISQDAENLYIPVVYAQMPPTPNISEFYASILRGAAFNYPIAARSERRQAQAIDMLRRVGTKLIFIDEIDNVSAGRHREIQTFFNALKYLSNELSLSIVAIGTKNAEISFQTDQQIGNRFRTLHLPLWEADEAYTKFIWITLKSYGLQPSEELKSKKTVETICAMTGGLIGETLSLIRLASIESIRRGEDQITLDPFCGVGWVEPCLRRIGGGR